MQVLPVGIPQLTAGELLSVQVHLVGTPHLTAGEELGRKGGSHYFAALVALQST